MRTRVLFVLIVFTLVLFPLLLTHDRPSLTTSQWDEETDCPPPTTPNPQLQWWSNCLPVPCSHSSSCIPVPDSIGPATGVICCVSLLHSLLLTLRSFLTENDLEYFLMYGTLLGAKREGDHIPWTADIDLGIGEGVLTELTENTALNRALSSRGLTLFPEKVPRMARVCWNRNARNLVPYANCTWKFARHRQYLHEYIYGDLYLYSMFNATSKDGESLWLEFSNAPCVYKQSTFFPLGKTMLRGQSFPAPRDPVAFFEGYYGDNWQQPTDHLRHGGLNHFRRPCRKKIGLAFEGMMIKVGSGPLIG